MSDTQIIEEFPNLVFRIRDFNVIRQTLLAEKYAVENRPLEVSYIYGVSGTGKTRSIYQKHNPKSICRITNYRAARGISFDKGRFLLHDGTLFQGYLIDEENL